MFLPNRATPRTNEIISTDHFRNKKCFLMAFHLRGKEEQWVWETWVSWGADPRAFQIPWWADCSSHSAKCWSDYHLQPLAGRLRCPHLGPGIQIQTVKKNKVDSHSFCGAVPVQAVFNHHRGTYSKLLLEHWPYLSNHFMPSTQHISDSSRCSIFWSINSLSQQSCHPAWVWTGAHVAQIDLKLTIYLRMTPNSWPHVSIS